MCLTDKYRSCRYSCICCRYDPSVIQSPQWYICWWGHGPGHVKSFIKHAGGLLQLELRHQGDRDDEVLLSVLLHVWPRASRKLLTTWMTCCLFDYMQSRRGKQTKWRRKVSGSGGIMAYTEHGWQGPECRSLRSKADEPLPYQLWSPG